MKKKYIKPQILQHPIRARRFMTGSPTTIEKGDPLDGEESKGIYV